MNLTQPPFDDCTCAARSTSSSTARRCVKSWGGAIGRCRRHPHRAGRAARNDRLKGYAPYGARHSGNLAKAKAEMKRSKYDANHDGICDAKACKSVSPSPATARWRSGSSRRSTQNLKSIGHHPRGPPVLEDAYTPIQTPRLNVPFSTPPGWGKDYADALHVLRPALRRPHIIPQGNTNYSLARHHAGHGQEGRRQGQRRNVPSVNAELDKCANLVGPRAHRVLRRARQEAHGAVVPWVPYLWS